VSIKDQAPSADQVKWLKDEVGAIHERNRQRGHADWCNMDFDFSCPSSVTYPFQWFWDSCFHAIALSHIDIKKAEAEIVSLLKNQHDDGFVSHVTFWQRDAFEEMVSTYAIAFRTKYLSDEMQPPLLAEAVQAVASRGRGKDFIQEVLPAVRRFYEWLHTVRNPYGDGLIRVVQPDETGLDHSPLWDDLMNITDEEHESWDRGWHSICDPYDAFNRDPKKMIELNHFVVADVMTNVIYIENLRVLAQLCLEIGESDAAKVYEARADKASKSLEELCWNEDDGLYYGVNGKENKQIKVNTFTSLMPILLPDLDQRKVDLLIRHITDPAEYWAEYPIPSVAMNHPTYRPETVGGTLVWRGPSWMNSNWYLARGLQRHGRLDLATHIANQSIAMVKKSGFREYYNPQTANGHGAPDFSWSTILLDLVMGVVDAKK
jgi:glycogen debranching enzyme